MSRTVLLVDDAPQLRDLARIALALEGWDVVAEAADGREAVRTAFDIAPDVIILDMQMPHMNGLTALPRLRRASPCSRIVMWSNEPDVAPRALAAGASAVVDKGAPIDHLLFALSLVAPIRG